jgi:PAS domain S-box-containing protein
MKDDYKTKKQLISELQELRQRISRCAPAISGNGKIEEAWWKSEERFRALTESTSDWIWETDKDGRYTYASPKIQELLGYASEEVIGKTPFDFMSPDEANRISKIFRSIVQSQKPFTALENRNIHKTGKQVIIETSGVPVFNEEGILAGYRGIDRNITQRRRVEEALKESEERFRATFEQAAVGVAHIRPDGRFLLVNRKFCDIVGYTREELLEKTFQEITYPYDLKADLQNVQMLLADIIQHYSLHKRCIRKDGSFIWTNLTASLVRKPMGEPAYLIGVIEDISEHKKLEEQLFQAQKMEAVGQLAGGIAHDFNNLLTAVIGYGNLLKAEVANDSLLRLYVTQILNAAEKAALLTRDLLTFGRRHLTNLQPVNLNKLLTNMENLLASILGGDMEFSMELSGNNVDVFADPAHLEQAVMNLAINARDAMPGGGRLLIKTDIVDLDAQFIKTHGFGRKGSYVVLLFEDTGTGMDEAVRGRIFEPFFTTKELGKGTGLGLAIVYGIVKQHDGFITVYSEPGIGSSFKIFLPLISQEDAENAGT